MKYKLVTEKEIVKLLNGQIQCDLPYPTFLTRYQDDTDGSREDAHTLTVSQGPDGDMYVRVGSSRLLRFRSGIGGGNSLRVHNALRILAKAIELDNKDRPLNPVGF